MRAAAVKSNKQNESRAAANSISQKKNDPKGARGFADNRTGPVASRQTTVPNGPAGMSKFIRLCAPSPVFSVLQAMKSGKLSQRMEAPIQMDTFINRTNDANVYPHLHINGQYVGYTYSRGAHVYLRTNRGAVQHGWKQTVTDCMGPEDWGQNRKAENKAIMDYIKDNLQAIWDER